MLTPRRKSEEFSLHYCVSMTCKCTTKHALNEITCTCLMCGAVKITTRYNPPKSKGKEDASGEELG